MQALTRRTEIEHLQTWLGTLSYNGIRTLESTFAMFLPGGKRVRGVDVGYGLFIGRDRQMYMAESERTARAVTPEEVLNVASLIAIKNNFYERCRARAIVRDSKRASLA